ncbi:MAG: restriction endonuclease [Gammaproteobacteria bacterium]|nr:ATPase [Gammaproteobacteria bacterium PRO8]MCL4778326.1 restriction endonuclease [Gammaproteobacteria bacterium]MCQ3933977.1 ATPase [Gammaproteobacteria bacterium]
MSPGNPLLVTKANGEQVPFDASKLRRSLERAGATPDMSAAIAAAIQPELQPGITTRRLYRMAFRLLHRQSRRVAGRYRLKQAILDLGPSGFPFEDFVARILRHEGYSVQVRVLVEGLCVRHEVDVIADREHQHFLVECKYHNVPGRVCDVKIPLYIQARFTDVAQRWQQQPGNGARFHQGWLVTNTRFSSDALRYGQCVGLNLVGWDQPAGGSLRERIDRSGLHPLTCLAGLARAEKTRLLEQGLVLARDVLEQPAVLDLLRLPASRRERLLREAAELCSG